MTKAVILDPTMLEELRARRHKLGVDRWDEVWDGVEHMVPSPTAEHQRIEKLLLRVLLEAVEDDGLGQVFHELNVADAEQGLENFRIPDISVVLRGGSAQVHEAFIAGGPDLVVEIRSPDDETYDKLPWYGRQGVREALIIDCDTKLLSLFRLHQGRMEPASFGESADVQVLPLRFEVMLQEGVRRLRVVHTGEPGRTWQV